MPPPRPCLVNGAPFPSAREAARALRADGHESASAAGISIAITRGGGEEGRYLGMPVRWGPPPTREQRKESARLVTDRLLWRGLEPEERAAVLAATPEERAAIEADPSRRVLAIGAAILRRRPEWAAAEGASGVGGAP